MRTLFGLILLLLTPACLFAGSVPERFMSPTGDYEVSFTVVEHIKSPETITHFLKDIGHITYRVDIFKLGEEKPFKTTKFTDVYGWEPDRKPIPVKDIFNMTIWSPHDDIMVLPYEGWASAPGTDVLKAIALNPALKWNEADFAFGKFVWIDDLSGIGDRHSDCDYSIRRFDGRTGKTIAVKPSSSPKGYELFKYEKGVLHIVEVMDNCRKEEKPPKCFVYNISNKKETVEACPRGITNDTYVPTLP